MWAWLAIAAAGMPMRVDPGAAGPVRAALDELWPEADVQLEIASEAAPAEPFRDDPADRLDWDGAVLVLTRGGQAIRAPATDPRTAVLLARSWLQVEAPPTTGWVPDLVVAPDLDPAPAPAPPPIPRTSPLWMSIGAQVPVAIVVSPAARLTLGASAGRLDGQLSAVWGPRALRVAAVDVTRDWPPPVALADLTAIDATLTWLPTRDGVTPLAVVGASAGLKERVRLPSLSVVDTRPRLGPIFGAGIAIPGPDPVSIRAGMELRMGYGLPLPDQIPGGRVLIGPTWFLDVVLRP